VKAVVRQFRKLTYVHTPRFQNILANSLASLASSLEIPLGRRSETIVMRRMDFPSTQDPWFEQFTRVKSVGTKYAVVEEDVLVLEDEMKQFEDGNPWYFDIENFFKDGLFPEYATTDDRKALRRIAQRYRIIGGVLHKRAFSGLFLRCITNEECLHILEATYASECGGHFNGQALTKKILKLYYWPTLKGDCVNFVRRCTKCQFYSNKIHAPSFSLHPISAPWPFAMWAFDVVGPLEDTISEIIKKSFILTATDLGPSFIALCLSYRRCSWSSTSSKQQREKGKGSVLFIEVIQ